MAYRVLIVDDQLISRQLFEHIINEASDYELVDSIDSAKKAEAYCVNRSVDLIIMDIVMKDDLNGLEAAARIKTVYPEIRILIVTAMADSAFLERARKAKVDSFWYKEIQDQPMMEVIERTMAGESVYPDQMPVIQLGNAMSSEFTERELDVLRELVGGYSNQEIAQRLNMSFHTVRFHISNLLSKTGCSSRTEMAILAARTGIVVNG